MDLIERSAAKASGMKRYFTGRPCRRGHIAERHIGGTCMECQREDKAAAYAAEPARFRDRVTQAYRRKNDGKLRHQRAKPSASERREKARLAVRDHYARNKDYYRERSTARRARKLSAVPAWSDDLNALVMAEASRLVRTRQQATGLRWHVDHMIPLAAKNCCGLHVWNNVQVIPEAMNKAKGNKMILTNPGDWIRHI